MASPSPTTLRRRTPTLSIEWLILGLFGLGILTLFGLGILARLLPNLFSDPEQQYTGQFYVGWGLILACILCFKLENPLRPHKHGPPSRAAIRATQLQALALCLGGGALAGGLIYDAHVPLPLCILGGLSSAGALWGLWTLCLPRATAPHVPDAGEHDGLPATPSGLHGDAHYATAAEMAQAGLTAPAGIPLGYHRRTDAVPLHYAGNQHLLTISSTRTGKGTTAILPTLLTHTASCIVVDPKGEAAAVTAQRRQALGHTIVYLNPFNEHGLPSDAVNPLASLDPASPYFVAQVAALADALVIADGGDTHWTDSARDLLEAFIMRVCLVAEETANPAYATLPTVRALLCRADEFPTLMQAMALHPFTPMANKAGRFTRDTREIQSIVSTAITQTRLLDNPEMAQALGASAFRWDTLKRLPTTVYLILPALYMDSHARWLRLMLTAALGALQTAERPPQPVLFVLDEFATLKGLSVLATAMGLAAGYGIQLWPILQDLNQLKDLYKTRWETFLANAGVIQVFRANDMTTAGYFSQRMGRYTATTTTTQQAEISEEQALLGFTGQHTSQSDTGMPLATSQALLGLPPDVGLVFLSGLQYPVRVYRRPYYHDPRYQGPPPLYAPNPLYG